MNDKAFVNSVFEYTTLEAAKLDELTKIEAKLLKSNWRRVWCNVTIEGVFAVYRRYKAR